MPVSDFLKEYMLKNGYTKADISRMSNIPYTTIDGLFKKGDENTKLSTLKKLAELIGCTIDDMAYNGDSEKITAEVPSAHPFPTVLQPAKYRKYKVLGNIACGSPIDAVQEEGEYLETDLNVHADYVLKCQGDSMINARIFDGDYVFIREQAEVENGEIAAVWMDNTVTLKRFYRYDEYIELRAENPMFKPIIIHETDFDSIRVIGKAVACQFWVK